MGPFIKDVIPIAISSSRGGGLIKMMVDDREGYKKYKFREMSFVNVPYI